MEKFNMENLKEGAKDLENINSQIEKEEDQNKKEKLLNEASALEDGLDLIEKELGLDENKLLEAYGEITPLEAYEELLELDDDKKEIEEDIKQGSWDKIVGRLRGAKLSAEKVFRLAACTLTLSMAVGAITPDSSYAQEGNRTKISAENKDENKEAFKDLLEWREKWKAEDIISDEELKNYIPLYTLGQAHAVDFLKRIVINRRLHEFAREKAKKEGTYKKYVKDGREIEEYSTSGLKWDYQKKNWVEDKINIINNDIETQNNTDGQEKISQEKLEVEDCFNNNGQNEFLRILKEKFGENGEKAFDFNVSLIKKDLERYQLGEISKDDLIKTMKKNNNNLRSMGTEFDVFDLDKIEKTLKDKSVIKSSGGADSDAW